ncbi:hypothetical protein RRG08_010990 [Elysia crispata]|uniref:Uncharacterized protein n=1 Tax=Elysia crispata TaxID=231223 RepID=A0AAE0ZQM1_9GAST|nr:hypothetical protein RRG08_010990 [Elysia crispata]
MRPQTLIWTVWNVQDEATNSHLDSVECTRCGQKLSSGQCGMYKMRPQTLIWTVWNVQDEATNSHLDSVEYTR